MNKVVAIGGGTGLSVLLRGLKNHGYDLTAVVSVADDGGNSGMLRNDLGILPPGDVRNCLLALASEESDMQELLTYRFKEGLLEGQNIGNLMIAASVDIFGSFKDAVANLSRLLKVQGTVLPVTSTKVSLLAELENGNLVLGESQIPIVCTRECSPIKDISLIPSDATANEDVLDAIHRCEMILIGPGSLYTSILPNLLIKDVSGAINTSSAKVLYIGNLMTQPGETDGFSFEDHTLALLEYININHALANTQILDDGIAEKYKAEGAEQVLHEGASVMTKDGMNRVEVIEDTFIEVEKGLVRHDVERIAAIMREIL